MLLGTVEQLETSVDDLASQIASVETEDLDRTVATDAVLRLERCWERMGAALGRFTSDLDVRGFHETDGACSMANWLASRTGQARSMAGSRCFLAPQTARHARNNVSLR